MTITLELTLEQEERLASQARTLGKPLEVYLREAVDALSPHEEPVHERAAVDDEDTLGKLIDACQVDTGIADFAHQHDHYLRGTPKKEQAC